MRHCSSPDYAVYNQEETRSGEGRGHSRTLVNVTSAGRERKYPDLVLSGVSFSHCFLMDSHLFTDFRLFSYIFFSQVTEKLRSINRPCAKMGSLVVPLYSKLH